MAPRATLICSIDLPGHWGDGQLLPGVWLRAFSQELAVGDAPVTVTVASAAVAGQVRAALPGRHEVALRAEAAWAGPETRRVEFARTLRSELEAARSQGVTISTLAWGDFPLTEHTDLLVKHGIHAVRTLAAERSPRWPRLFGRSEPATPQAHLVRYGICTLPVVAQWRSGQGTRGIRKPLVECMRDQGLAHLACDLGETSLEGPLEGYFRQALRELMRHLHAGPTRMETVAEFASRRLAAPKSLPAQSILRAA